MKVLILTPLLPWPPSEGGRIAQYRTLQALEDVCDITIVAPVFSEEQIQDAVELGRLLPKIKVRAVACFDRVQSPTPKNKPSAYARARGFLGRVLRKILPPPRASLPTKTGWPIQEPKPFNPFEPLDSRFVSVISEEIERGCDTVQAEFANMLSLGPFLPENIPKVFVHHQLHFVYARRFVENLGVSSAHQKYLMSKMAEEERAFLRFFDKVVVFSEHDGQEMHGFLPEASIVVSPFPCPEDPIIEPKFSKEPLGYLLVASEFEPNLIGFSWFMEKVWPILKKEIPKATISVAGKWSQASIERIHNNLDVKFLGFVPNLNEIFENRIMIVPLQVGSGIRTKILAGWSQSCPVVSTPVGAEGLPIIDGKNILIAETPLEFAEKCIEIFQNFQLRCSVGASGLETVRENYSLEAIKSRRLEIYSNIRCKGKL
jgi:glycosyltransferase involved in cell wall biosynthesis